MSGTDTAAIKAVRAIHKPRTFDGDGYGWSVCVEDRQRWPCATEQAIRDAYDGKAPR